MADDIDLSEGERSVLTLHPHRKTVLWPVLLLALIAIAAAVTIIVIPAGQYATPARIAVAAVAVVLAVILTAIPLLRWRTTTYQLTTRRLRLRSGILSRSGRGPG